MNRIEEIKSRLHNFKTAPRDGEPKGLPWDTIQVIGVWADNAPSDVEYLLAKLEIAEMALITLALHAEARKERDIGFETVENVCNKILQQIRE